MSSAVLTCPECEGDIWDMPHGHKLAKCWACGLAFDTMEDDDEPSPGTYCDVCGRRDSWGCGHTGSQRRDARRHNATRAHREGRCWHYDHSACGPECQSARDRQPRTGWLPLVTHASQAAGEGFRT